MEGAHEGLPLLQDRREEWCKHLMLLVLSNNRRLTRLLGFTPALPSLFVIRTTGRTAESTWQAPCALGQYRAAEELGGGAAAADIDVFPEGDDTDAAPGQLRLCADPFLKVPAEPVHQVTPARAILGLTAGRG